MSLRLVVEVYLFAAELERLHQISIICACLLQIHHKLENHRSKFYLRICRPSFHRPNGERSVSFCFWVACFVGYLGSSIYPKEKKLCETVGFFGEWVAYNSHLNLGVSYPLVCYPVLVFFYCNAGLMARLCFVFFGI